MKGYTRYDNPPSGTSYRRLKKVLFFFAIVFAILVGAFFSNQITAIEVVGNEHYTEEEVKDLIINGSLERNAWYLYWKYKYMDTSRIPFVDTVEVFTEGRGKVKIQIYEKGIIGYVEYLGSYMYFDKDGIVVESSNVLIEEIPLVSGLNFNKIVLHEKLEVEKDEVFDSLLELTKLLKKNKVIPGNIYCNDDLEVTLYFGKTKVLLGKDENTDEKIIRLSYLMKELKDKEGTLHMENFNEDTKNITFEMKTKEKNGK